MKICPNCGTQVPDNKKFCTECGTSMANVTPQPVYTPPVQPQQPVYTQPAYNGDMEPDKDSKYAPVSTKSFLGIMLLMLIPVVGWVLLLIWAIGAKKVNKRNMARASLIMTVIVLVISIVLGMLAKSFAVKVVEKAKAEARTMIEQQLGAELGRALGGEEGTSGGILGGLLGSDSGNLLGGLLGGDSSGLGALGGLLGEDFSAEDMAELEDFLNQLQEQDNSDEE